MVIESMPINVSDNSTVEDVEKQFFEVLKKLRPEVTDQEIMSAAKEFVKRVFGWLNCPLTGKKINSMGCMLCSCGHMTECHFPYVCSDKRSKCNHYQQEDPTEF